MRTHLLGVALLCAAGMAVGAETPDEQKARWRQEAGFPVIDLSGETARQVVIAEGSP